MLIPRSLLLSALLFVAGGVPATADSMVSASTQLSGSGLPYCTESGPVFASCDQSVQSQSATAYASNGWIYGSAQNLTTYVYASDPFSHASANVKFADAITVAGATGPGNLVMTFIGFLQQSVDLNGYMPDRAVVALGNYAIVPPLFGIGRFANGYVSTTVSLPIDFDTPTPFSVSFSNNASGTFHGQFTSTSSIYSSLQFPSIIITDTMGNAVPEASLVFTPALLAVPEPGTWPLAFCGLLLLLSARHAAATAAARQEQRQRRAIQRGDCERYRCS